MPEKKQSSTILNLLLIIFGAIFLIQGVVNALGLYLAGFTLPTWLAGALGATTEAQGLLGASEWSAIALGVWALICGIAMFFEEEWAMGMALVVLSLMAINAIPKAIDYIMNGYWGVVYTYVYILVGIVGVVGFIYLLITSKRYH
ncbi:MAG: hypothetical protein EU530_11115 [Promethearchaeota archaeon]|nr:MAG: hypothetical protein EU530_11115 [Candidatus Lokiarchaeota archaeon]